MQARSAIIEIDGRAAPDHLPLGLAPYGHFTAMQIRGRRTRGLELHLRRLDGANQELFGAGIDGDELLERIGHALGDVEDASVRVYVLAREGGDGPSTVVTVRPPGEAPERPLHLEAVPYQRTLPHVKHIGDFGQTYYRRLVQGHGGDDALFAAPDGTVSECGIANIAFVDETGIVWPDAPALAGITMQLLEPRLAAAGLRSRRAPVRLSDLPDYRGAFVTNARGVAPVAQIDDLVLAVDAGLMASVVSVYGAVPWDEIGEA